MFKNLISSINGQPARDSGAELAIGAPKKPPATKTQPPKLPDNQKTSNGYQKMADAQAELGGDANKRRTLSKRGRQKLSAMMGKLQSIGKKDARETNNNNRTGAIGGLEQEDQLEDSNSCCAARQREEDADSSSSREFLSAEFDLDLGSEAPAKLKVASVQQEAPEEEEEEDQSEAYRLDDKANYVLPEEQCDIPTFLHTNNCDPYLIEETRRLLKERFAKNPDNFYEHDYKRMMADDWTVSRFLLRRRLDPKRTAKLMEECGRFRKQYKMSEVELWEFPIEFHKAGGLFKFAPDRVGNLTVYMRVKMYRRVPEISDVFKAFILCVLEEADRANGGRGTAVIFDLSACGLQNVDLGFLSWLLSSFRNYCPKGVSYILVYNLPWILNATCKLAMTWMSASNRRALRFVYGDEIENFIDRNNLPDYLGGSCKINYRAVPAGAKPATEVCDQLDMTREQALKIRELFKEYLDEEDFTEEEKRTQKVGKAKKQTANGSSGAH